MALEDQGMRTGVVDTGALLGTPITPTQVAEIAGSDPVGPVPQQLTWQAWALAVTQAFTFYQAISGGFALIENRFALPAHWLAQTPFDSWAVFGWLMIGLIAIPQLVAALLTFLAPRRARIAVLAGLATGATLIAWVFMQVAVMHAFFYAQPIVVAVGLVQIALAVSWRRRLIGDATEQSSRTQ